VGKVYPVTPKALMRRLNVLIPAAAALMLGGCTSQPALTYDLVIANGRVADPESGLDGVRYIGIRGVKIDVVSPTPLAGA
jgi:hypothetical protein